MRLRTRFVTLVAVDAAGALTAAVVVLPFLRPAYRSAPLHATLETACGLIALLAAQAVCMVFYAVAAVGFARKAERSGDGLLRWFAPAAALAAVGRANYSLFPSLYTQWVYVGDVPRFAAHLLLLGGVVREIGRYQQGVAQLAAFEERPGRVGSGAFFLFDSDVRVPPQTRETLLRIVREAVTNAHRHGQAQVITVELSNHQGLLLRIADDGQGFDPTAVDDAGGFGLSTMRARARALGGVFSVESQPALGTTVEVVLP